MDLQWSKLCIHPGVVLRSSYRTITSSDSTCALLGLGSDSSHTQEPCPSSSISYSLTQSKAWTSCDGSTQSKQPVSFLSRDHWDAKKLDFCQQDEECRMARKYGVVYSGSCSQPAMNCQVTGNFNLSVPVHRGHSRRMMGRGEEGQRQLFVFDQELRSKNSFKWLRSQHTPADKHTLIISSLC